MKKFFLLTFVFLPFSLIFSHEMTVNSPLKDNPPSLFLKGDFLYWKAEIAGLYYAHDCQVDDTEGQDIVFESEIGNLKKIKTNWDPGLELLIGYLFPYDNWEMSLKWTYFSTKASSSFNSITPTFWGHTSHQDASFANRAQAHWKLSFNVEDLEISRDSWMGDFLSIRPYVGIRGAEIKQNFQVHYEIDNSHQPTKPFTNTIKPKSNFLGFGAKGGLDLQFLFNSFSGIYTNGSVSLLYGRFNSHLIVDQLLIEYDNNSQIANSKDKFYQSIYTAQLGLGLKFGKNFNRNNRIEFRIGWEQNIWFGINKMQHYVHKLIEGKMIQQSENLSLQGLVLNMKVDF